MERPISISQNPADPKPVKHLRSSLEDLREMFERSITIRSMAQELEFCNVGDEASEIKRVMNEKNFDIYGVEENGIVDGYVRADDLRTGECKGYRKTIYPSELVADSTPVRHVLPVLRNAPRVFVLEKNRVYGIVTQADLQKAPVRLYLFGLVTLLEMQLLRLVRLLYPDESWKAEISSDRLEEAEKLLEDRQSRNEEIDLADCLQFGDKCTLLMRHKKKPREAWNLMGFKSKTSGRKLLSEIQNLRNNLAHSQDIIASSGWEETIDLAGGVEELLGSCEQISAQEKEETSTSGGETSKTYLH